MDAQIIPRHRYINKSKYQYGITEIGDDYALELSVKYKDTEGQPLTKIEDEDLHWFLRLYSSNTRVMLANVQEIFHCSYTHFLELMKSEKWAEEYANAKKLRGDLHVMEGYQVASTPFNKIQQGEEISMVEVASAKLLANYDMNMAQALNPEWGNKGNGNRGGGNINLVVNTPIKLGI